MLAISIIGLPRRLLSKTKFTVHTFTIVIKPFDHPEIDLIHAKFWVTTGTVS
jgi:hypothetical protein